MLEDRQIEKLTQTELKNLAINCYSCLKENGKKINYWDYLKSMKNEACNQAIVRIFEKIDLLKINSFIDGISCMSSIRKEFYQKILALRYEMLKDIYQKLI